MYLDQPEPPMDPLVFGSHHNERLKNLNLTYPLQLKSYLSSSMILSQPREDGELFIYLEVANFAVNVVLMWEEKGSRN